MFTLHTIVISNPSRDDEETWQSTCSSAWGSQYLLLLYVCHYIFLWLPFTYPFPSDFVVQGHRGDIIEGIGCVPSTYNVSLAYPLYFVWPTFISFVAAIYSTLSFRAFLWHRRRNTVDELFTSGYSISKDHYLRLMCFSLIPSLLMFPLTLFGLISNIKLGPRPWISWENTHSHFNRFDTYPEAVLKTNTCFYASWLIELWSCSACCFLFFIFLGMKDEQRGQYMRWFFVILRPFGIKPSSSTDSPTLWQRLFGRSTTLLKPTPFNLSGATSSISVLPVDHGPKHFPKTTDTIIFGLRFNDYPRTEEEESGNP